MRSFRITTPTLDTNLIHFDLANSSAGRRCAVRQWQMS
jgi:hypothetical protein